MNKIDVLAHLAKDKPLFHYVDGEGVQRAAQVGYKMPQGEFSMSVSAGVLSWIADHVTADMTTIETGAGHTTVLFAALAKHHYCCTYSEREADKITEYLKKIGVPSDKVTFVFGSTDVTLPQLKIEKIIDFAYVDGCHGYPLPALDWHYIDKHLKIGGTLGMDNAEIRPVREHCEFLEENGSYQLVGHVMDYCFVMFYKKLIDQNREWIDQPYSRAKKDPCDWRWPTRIKRKVSKWVKPYLY